MRGDRPNILVAADATDPAATGNALAALTRLATTALRREIGGPTADLRPRDPAVDIIVHRRYNPAGDTQLNIVPGLLGVVLTLTMLIFTSLAVTREIERGTMESLLAMPVRPVEVMLGKIVPYIFVGFVQTALILVAAYFVFAVPMRGNLMLLSPARVLFIAAMLAVGYHLLDPGAESAPGDADGVLLLSADRCCCRASCFRFAACRNGRSGLARCCR